MLIFREQMAHQRLVHQRQARGAGYLLTMCVKKAGPEPWCVRCWCAMLTQFIG